MNKPPFVVAISGVSGGGKTAVSKRLNQELPRSWTLFFDQYRLNGPDDFVKWIDSGGDPNEWDLTPLMKDLNDLMKEPLDFIILDFPFSYEHAEIARSINLSVFIDTPLDIALARRVIRDFKDSQTVEILSDLENYITRGRPAYLHMLETIKPGADLIIDGSVEIDKIVHKIEKELTIILKK